MEDYFKVRKDELLGEAQKMKDRFIDDMLRRFNDFNKDWNDVVTKLNLLEKATVKDDKLNK